MGRRWGNSTLFDIWHVSWDWRIKSLQCMNSKSVDAIQESATRCDRPGERAVTQAWLSSSRYPFHENALVALWHLHTVTSHRPATDLKRPFTKGYVPIHRWLPPPSVATSRLNARPLWPFRQKHVPKAMVHVLQLLRIERPMAYLWELFQGKVGLAERVCSNLSFHLSVDRHASFHLSVDCHNMPHLLRTAYHS